MGKDNGRDKRRWVDIYRSVGVEIDGQVIIAAIWNPRIDTDSVAIRAIVDYAREWELELAVELPGVIAGEGVACALKS